MHTCLSVIFMPKIDVLLAAPTPWSRSSRRHISRHSKQGGVFETPWAVPVTAEERILPTAFPLSFENKFIENVLETILSFCLCLFIHLSLCVELLLGFIKRTVPTLEISIC